MPTLISKYKKVQTVSRLKQVYSRMLNATEIAVQDTGLEPEDWLPEDKKSLSEAEKKQFIYENYIKPYMKTSKYNKTEGSFYDESGAKYTFERGQASAFWTPQKDYYPGLLGTISVDIDGDKGKNQNGYDIFYFSYNVKDKQYFSTPKGSIFSLLSCGYTIGFNIGFEEYKNIAYHKPGTYPDCQKDDDATCCGDIIMREGWQIKDDYPFKF